MSAEPAAPLRLVGEASALARLDPQALLTTAVERGASIETLERLVALATDVRQLLAAEAFHHAMAEFQARVGPIHKTQTAKIQTARASYSYDFAPLAEVLAAIKPHLSAVGIHHAWHSRSEPGKVFVACRLTHRLGHCEDSGELELPVSQDDGRGANGAQRVASALSYGKRYTLQNICGLAPEDEDDDGAGAGAGAAQTEAAPPPFDREVAPSGEDPITEERGTLVRVLFEWFREQKMGSTKRADWLRDKFGEGTDVTRLDPVALRDVLTAQGVLKS